MGSHLSPNSVYSCDLEPVSSGVRASVPPFIKGEEIRLTLQWSQVGSSMFARCCVQGRWHFTEQRTGETTQVRPRARTALALHDPQVLRGRVDTSL